MQAGAIVTARGCSVSASVALAPGDEFDVLICPLYALLQPVGQGAEAAGRMQLGDCPGWSEMSTGPDFALVADGSAQLDASHRAILADAVGGAPSRAALLALATACEAAASAAEAAGASTTGDVMVALEAIAPAHAAWLDARRAHNTALLNAGEASDASAAAVKDTETKLETTIETACDAADSLEDALEGWDDACACARADLVQAAGAIGGIGIGGPLDAAVSAPSTAETPSFKILRVAEAVATLREAIDALAAAPPSVSRSA